eukprot:35623_1
MAVPTLYICRHYANGRYGALEALTISLSFTSMLAILIISIHSMKQLPKQKKIETKFKILYTISITSATICILATMISTITCVNEWTLTSTISLAITFPSYYTLVLVLLATFIARLYYTFRFSVYAISNKNKTIFLVLFIICSISSAIAVILYVISLFDAEYYDQDLWNDVDNKTYMTTAISFFLLALILYVSISIWTSKIFVSNLMKVTQLSGNSLSLYMKARIKQEDSNDENDSDDMSPQLNERQIKMIDNVSKYVSLFSVAIGSSIITLLVISSNEWIHWGGLFVQILFIFLNTDCIVNIMCIYLQYNFTGKYYRRYVKFIERVWKPIFVKKAKTDMVQAYHVEHVENKHVEMTALNETSGDDTSS